MNECYNIVVVVKVATAVRGGGLDPRTAIEGSFSAWGGLGKPNRSRDRGETAARLTAVAIAIVTRPFEFHEISVSNTSSSFVSSIHSFGIGPHVSDLSAAVRLSDRHPLLTHLLSGTV